nr:MAG TPA: hypothetical protein [Bacteriophage sp.]
MLLTNNELQAINKNRVQQLEQWRAKNKLEYQRVRIVQSKEKEKSIKDFVSKNADKIDGTMPFVFWIYILIALIYISTWFFK